MKAFFVAFDTSLTTPQLASQRRKLASLLGEHRIELDTLRVGQDAGRVVKRLVMHAKATPVVALDDGQALPNRADWLADLTRNVIDLPPDRRPQLVYVTRRANADGHTQALEHPVVRCYLGRDDRGRWVQKAADEVVELTERLAAGRPEGVLPSPVPGPEIVGQSPCFVEAIGQLQRIMHSPYGLVTGQQGSGKMFFIRTLCFSSEHSEPTTSQTS